MRYVFIYIVALFLFSCNQNDSVEPVDLGLDYYPIQTGSVRIYDVDSFVYDNNTGTTTIDTFNYQYKEVVSEVFTDLTGAQGQKVERYFRMNDSDSWFQANTWTLIANNEQVQRVEENIRFVKLVFPIVVNKRWNGNMYNAQDNEQYRILYTNRKATYGNVVYNNTLLVQQAKELNAVDDIEKKEVYAKNVGLVYKLSDSINTQVSGSRGYRYRITLKSYSR